MTTVAEFILTERFELLAASVAEVAPYAQLAIVRPTTAARVGYVHVADRTEPVGLVFETKLMARVLAALGEKDLALSLLLNDDGTELVTFAETDAGWLALARPRAELAARLVGQRAELVAFGMARLAPNALGPRTGLCLHNLTRTEGGN